MSSKSNNQGRGYEFASILVLEEEISHFRPITIHKDSSYEAAKEAWDTLDVSMQNIFMKSARAAALTIFELEPRVLEYDAEPLDLYIQQDAQGISGDVRDIVIIRKNIAWEIGLSLKHNHLAVKHSRLSSKLDFGNSWYGVPCSPNYWKKVAPVFAYLQEQKEKNVAFKSLPNKQDLSVEVLNAFMEEIEFQYQKHKDLPAKMVEYLLGKYDFYKVISVDNKALTLIQTFNLHGTLNKPTKTKHPKYKVPIAVLPKRIVSIDFKPQSVNTVEIFMDGGWQFSFRLHNARTTCEPSFKFDVRIIGMPALIMSLESKWN